MDSKPHVIGYDKAKALHALSEIMAFAFAANSANYTVFVDYSGHTNQVDVRVYHGGWVPKADFTHKWTAYAEDTSHVDHDSVQDVLKKLTDDWSQFIRRGENNA